MTQFSPVKILTQPSDIDGLLSEMERGKTLVLTRRGLIKVESGGPSIRRLLGECFRHPDQPADRASREIFESEADEQLGHSPRWVEAGETFEELIRHLELKESIDFIICVDPWVGQILGRSGELASNVRWVLISDLSNRKKVEHDRYWEEMERWFGGLPFSFIVSRDPLERAIIATEKSPGTKTEQLRIDRLHSSKPGSWQWRRISISQEAASGPGSLILLIRYSGSLSHLKVLLDSLATQDYPKDALEAIILSKRVADELDDHLQWMALSHPKLRCSWIDTSADSWPGHLNDGFKRLPDATLLLIDDHVVLPKQFARSVQAIAPTKHPTALFGACLSVEASAHIITGNLDPQPDYETLHQAFAAHPSAQFVESARVIPSELWNRGEGEQAHRILRFAQEPLKRGGAKDSGAPGISLLQLADLR